MIYDIRLTISHSYAQLAGNGRHLVRVLPKFIKNRQRVLAHLLEILPIPEERTDSLDFFGNTTSTAIHLEAHKEMIIRMSCRVELTVEEASLDLSPDLAALQREWEVYRGLEPASPLHFLGPTWRLSQNSEIGHFAKEAYVFGESAYQTVQRVGKAIHHAITFDPEATTVDTDAAEAFRLKRGVCQDMSHIMILALHSLGIPAGYVSGYLRTFPPEGGEKLEGADAMHAWVKAWCGARHGWVEYDPTNAIPAGRDHIVVGYGRDYSDVSPVIGHLRSSGGQTNAQSVDVKSVTLP